MLMDYVEMYIEAKSCGDKNRMTQIERDLQKLGMDKYTLMVLVKELEEEK